MIHRVVLVSSRDRVASDRRWWRGRPPLVSAVHGYVSFAGALAAALHVDVTEAGEHIVVHPRWMSGAIVVCPWPVALRRDGAGAERSVVIDGPLDGLIARAPDWNLLAGVSSTALSLWQQPMSFAEAHLVGRLDPPSTIGGIAVEGEPPQVGHVAFRVPGQSDLIALLARYIHEIDLIA